MRWFVRAVLAASLASLITTPAFADDTASAEVLFDEGRKLLDQGKLPEACTKLEASNRLDPAVGTLLNLGECNERRGKLASAWSNFRAASSLAQSRSDGRAAFAKKKADGLEPKLATLTISVSAAEPGLKVTRDGAAVDDAVWGTAVPIDSGPHQIEARAPGKKPFTAKIAIAEGAPSVVRVEPLVAEDAVATTPVSPVEKPATTTTNPSSSNTGTIVGIVGLGVGAVGIGLGTYFAIHAKSTWNDASSHCNGANQCDDDGFNANQDARKSGNIATIALTAGIVVAVAGVACLLFWPKPSSSATKTALDVVTTGASF